MCERCVCIHILYMCVYVHPHVCACDELILNCVCANITSTSHTQTHTSRNTLKHTCCTARSSISSNNLLDSDCDFVLWSLSLSHTHTALLAIVIPFLDDLISLLGAVASSSLALTFPALIDLFTHWHVKHQKFLYIFPRPVWICKNLFIILLGVLGCVCGTLASVYSIVEDFSKVNGTAGVCD